MAVSTSQLLIALPFNALSLRSTNEQRGRLWQQACALFKAEDEERQNPANAASYMREYFNERFARRGWSVARIIRERDQFLRYETHHFCKDEDSPPYMQDSYFAVLAHESRIVGEFSLNYCHQYLGDVAGFDYLAPEQRGKKLGHGLLELRLRTAAALGYDEYRAAVYENNPESFKRLERLVEAGKARKTLASDGRLYHVDLNHFR